MQLEAAVGAWLFNKQQAFKRFRQGLVTAANTLRMGPIAKIWLGFLSISISGFTLGLLFIVWMSMPALDVARRNLQNEQQVSAIFFDIEGKEIGRRGSWRTEQVPLSEMPDYFIQSVLATEDRRFFSHVGLDFFGLARAMMVNAQAGGVVQGGSTLTQQLAKNLFLSSERSLTRKVNEAFLSLWLEARYTKLEILRLYFDRTYMGAGVVGVDAAAEYYFGKSIRDVKLSEAAMLAGMFKAPTRYAPHANLPRARGRANEVLSNLVEAGFMTEGQVYNARRNPAKAIKRRDETAGKADYFLDYAFQELLTILPKESSVVKVFTTVDLEMQRIAEEAVEASFRENAEKYQFDQSSFVAANADGGVRALIGGRDYGESQFNRATQALRQPGSAFKPIVYATALENGYRRSSRVTDGPVSYRGWSPKNYYSGYKGRVTLQSALAISINTIPVKLTKEFTLTAVAKMATNLGVESPVKRFPSLPLGASEVTLMDMANVYNVFLNKGIAKKLHAIKKVETLSGDTVFDREKSMPEPKRVIKEQTALDMNIMLHNVIYGGTARRAQIEGIPTSGKTGTTSSYVDGWFVGYTGNLVAAVWAGNDSTRPTNRLSGGNVPAMTWQYFMSRAHQRIAKLNPIPGVDFKIMDRKNELAIADASDQTINPDDVSAPQPKVQTFVTTISARLSDVLLDLNLEFIGLQSSIKSHQKPGVHVTRLAQ